MSDGPRTRHLISLPAYIVSLAQSTQDRKSTRLNSSHDQISYAVFCLKKKTESHGHVAIGGGQRQDIPPALHAPTTLAGPSCCSDGEERERVEATPAAPAPAKNRRRPP